MTDIGQIIHDQDNGMEIDDTPNGFKTRFSYMVFASSPRLRKLKSYLVDSCKLPRVMIVMMVIVSIILLALLININGKMINIHEFVMQIEDQGKGM